MRAVARDLTARGVSIPPGWGYDFDNTVAQVFTMVHAPVMALDLERVIAEFEPQLVVCDVFEYGAPGAAGAAGLPCVSHASGSPSRSE
jgi:hypothetical protein